MLRLVELLSVVALLVGLWFTNPWLLLVLAGLVGLVVVDRVEVES